MSFGDDMTPTEGNVTVTERLLNYDHGITPQETFYWCGPASTQVVLNGLGIIKSEQDLADELGTTVKGTDYVGLIADVLNKHTDGAYEATYVQNDPPTQDQSDELWADIKRSIDSGYGVVVNIDAPPTNYPRGVKGSESPHYGGGEVLHYFAVMGYDDGPLKSVWVADSGFWPYGYWMAFDQLASLVPPKGYAAATKAAEPAPSGPGTARSDEMSWGEIVKNFNGQEVSREDMIKHMDARLERMERVVLALLDQIGGAGVGSAVAQNQPTNFSGFTQGGNRSLYDLVSASAARAGVSGARDVKAGK